MINKSHYIIAKSKRNKWTTLALFSQKFDKNYEDFEELFGASNSRMEKTLLDIFNDVNKDNSILLKKIINYRFNYF